MAQRIVKFPYFFSSWDIFIFRQRIEYGWMISAGKVVKIMSVLLIDSCKVFETRK